MIKLGLYKHYKGKYCKVKAMGVHSETGEGLVVYECGGSVWCRPVGLFTGVVTLESGYRVPRFEYIGDET